MKKATVLALALVCFSSSLFAEAKRESTSVGISLGSLSAQAFIIGAALNLPEEYNPSHLFTSLALMIPPATPFYHEDWDTGAMIVGTSVLAGSFNFVGFSLLKSRSNHWHYRLLGYLMVISAVGLKLYSIGKDLQSAVPSTRRTNEKFAGSQVSGSAPMRFAIGSSHF